MPVALTSTPTSALRNDFGNYVGFRFTVGATPLNVTHLARWKVSGNTQTHTVKLVDSGTQADVPGGSVSIDMTTGTDGAYLYVALASPVTLAASTPYVLVSLESNGGDEWHNEDLVTWSADLTVNNSSFWDGSNFTISVANASFVPLNFQYSLVGSGNRRRRFITAAQ